MAEPTLTASLEDVAALAGSLKDDVEAIGATIEEADQLGVVLSDQQGLRGPRGFRGPEGPTGPRGERGLAGASSGATAELVKRARVPMSAGRIVRLDGATHCTPVSARDRADALTPVGLAVHAVSAAEDDVAVLTYGELEDDTWRWTTGDALFVGLDGFLTNTPSDAFAYVRVVALAISPTRVFVDPQLPVFQGGR